MPSSVAGSNFKFWIESVGGRWLWSVAVDNVPNYGQMAQIRDIQSPYGPLAVANVPIPGDVVVEMANSLSQFLQQLAPHVSLISASSYSLTVTEGDAALDAATLQFQNIGAFGSFMTVAATPDAGWMMSNPSAVAGISKNQQGQAVVRVLPASMLATSSPFTGHVNLQDNANPPNTVAVTFNVVVLPRPTISTTPTPPVVSLTYSLSAQSAGGAATIVITNSGPSTSQLNVTLARVLDTSAWLNITPTSGGPMASGDYVNIVFSVISAAVPVIPGVYTETVRITSPNATNTPIDISVTLTVSP